MRKHSYDLYQPTDSFHDNQTHFYMKGFTQRLVLKQRHKDTFIHELLTGAFHFRGHRFDGLTVSAVICTLLRRV